MLDYIRIALYTLLIAIGFFLVQAWEREHPKAEVAAAPVVSATPDRYVPEIPAPVAGSTKQPAVQPVQMMAPQVAKGQLVNIKTDVLDVTIDTHGGDIISVKLLNYPETLGSATPFLLLNDDAKTRYIAESGLLSKQGPDTPQEQAIYTVTQTAYALSPGQQGISVNLHWQKDGLTVVKRYTFTRGSYEIQVGFDVDNQSSAPWEGSLYTSLMRTDSPPPGSGGFVNLATYFGAAISSPDKPFTKIPFKQMREKNLNETIKDGWAAMIQHYFISAWIPPQHALSTYYSKILPNGLYTIGMIGSPLTAAPGNKISTQAKLYSGPAVADQLEKAAPGLKLTIDYGWFWYFSAIIFWMMQKIHEVIGNWGWSIVLVTIVIKLLFYQLSAKSYRSMSALKRLQPRLEKLKERFGDDKQKLTQATIDLYRQEKVNPMSGCLPILIQIPVFIALYWVLVESVELRQAPFILWIHDLSQPDPFYILPVLMGISMYIQQRLNPPPPDPLQAKVMMAMPFIFMVLFANFPSGLMLYWFVNNTLSFLQQWHIMRSTTKETNGKSK